MAKIVALILLLGILLSATPAIAAPDEVKWSRVDIPTEGKPGDWVLADGSDVRHLEIAIDGTFYCYANPSGTNYTLFKSTDEGKSWSYTGKVKDAIVDIATAPNDASVVYCATLSNVYKSTDAAHSFTKLAANPGGAGSNNIEITSIDVTPLDSHNIIAASTRNTAELQFGGVYILNETKPFSGWVDTNIGVYDVHTVAFSPNFASDQQLVAVVSDETDTLVTTKVGGADWGGAVGDAIIEELVPASACIAFPDDYDADIATGFYVQFVAIDAEDENGDVYMLNGVEAPGSSKTTDLNIGSAYDLSNVDVTTLAVTGIATDAQLLAGAASSAQVYFSTDGGTDWAESTKQPTGKSKTYVIMAPDFADIGKAYAATSGTESAFSVSQDSGDTWNQIGLIDTDISAIIDLAPSPSYSQDDALFMLTWGGEHSLWRSLNGGKGFMPAPWPM